MFNELLNKELEVKNQELLEKNDSIETLNRFNKAQKDSIEHLLMQSEKESSMIKHQKDSIEQLQKILRKEAITIHQKD